TPTPYDNAGSQDHNQVLGADVTHEPELTNSVQLAPGPSRVRRISDARDGSQGDRPSRTVTTMKNTGMATVMATIMTT
ncbi:hypothetical protein ACFWA5_37250, partial [Streptomyces mirabilis]|uniref:hypothetical protein n=1 Tax=Streptomyces mirabilis TaxID=68239 RepID=UPI003652E4AA